MVAQNQKAQNVLVCDELFSTMATHINALAAPTTYTVYNYWKKSRKSNDCFLILFFDFVDVI